MNVLLNYIIQVIIISGILYSYYHIALRNKRFHQYNRFYLLASTILSLIIPLLDIPVYFSSSPQAPFSLKQTLSVIADTGGEEQAIAATGAIAKTSWFGLQNTLLFLYCIVAALLLARIFLSLVKITRLVRNNPVEKLDSIQLVSTDAPGTPFSFFKWLFWNKNIELQSEKGKQIFRHELFHIRQGHSWDVIFMELVTIVLWINPFFHLAKKEARTIHEFLADQFAMQDRENLQYAELLLMLALRTNQSLVNPFFHSQIKRRIAMITSSKKPSYQYIRKMMLLPLAAIIIGLFAFSYKSKLVTLQLNSNEKFTVVIDAGHGGSDAGATATDGTLEKDITLAIAKRIKALSDDDIEIILTRDEDALPELKTRVEHTGKHKADLFLTLHVNSTAKTPTDKTGFELVISKKNKTFEARNKMLANIMLNNFSQLFSVNKNILQRDAGIYVLDNAPCPSALIECGYLTNPKDLRYIKDPVKQDQIANAILQGIKLFALQKEKAALAITETAATDTSAPKTITIKGKDKKENTITLQLSAEQLKLYGDRNPDPLFVLDGVKLPDGQSNSIMRTLDPDKIYSISVLKGASAIQKYGDSGSNGVIEIITKEKALLIDSSIVKPAASNKIFTAAEIEPAFPGGAEKWKKYLQTNLDRETPGKNGAPKMNYTVTVKFIVKEDGSISDVQALTNHGYGMEEEAIRIIKKGPKWLPAIQNGHTVTAYKTQPVTFIMQEAEVITLRLEKPGIPTITLKELKNATAYQLLRLTKDAKIINYVFTTDTDNGNIVQAVNSGSEFSAATKKAIQSMDAGKLITFDQITISENGTEKKIPGKVYQTVD